MAEAVEHLPLSVLYQKAKRLLDDFKSGNHAAFADAHSALQQCEMLVDRAGLFSKNEDKEDLQTSSLQYLLVPFMKADLLSASRATDPSERHRHIASAVAAYSAFLEKCQQYELLGRLASQVYATEVGEQRMDPNSQRAAKVERFKRNKAITGLIQQLSVLKLQAEHHGQVR
jgi:hypothetical protein